MRSLDTPIHDPRSLRFWGAVITRQQEEITNSREIVRNDRKMKVLALAPTTEPDTGWGRYSDAVVRHLRQDWDLDVIVPRRDPAGMIQNPQEALKTAKRVRSALRAGDYDALLSLVDYPYSVVSYLATVGHSVPYFVVCHGTYSVAPLHANRSRPIARHAHRNAAQLFPVSSFTAEQLQEAQPGLDNVTIARNGVDLDRWSNSVEPYPIDHRALLTVGPFKQRKGQLFSLKAFAEVAEEFPDVQYHFVGNTERAYFDTVRDYVSDSGLEDRVHFEGYVTQTELRRWYETATAYLMTPEYVDHDFEGFGLVYLEANAHGTPTIGTTATGARDAIEDGYSGLCVDHNVDAVSTALRRILGDEALRRELSSTAREWARANSWERTVDVLRNEISKHATDEIRAPLSSLT